MNGRALVEALVRAGVRHASGVPCSYFGSFFLEAAKGDLRYVPAPHEGLAVSLAAGWALAGELPCVLMQNSGLGNAVNPLTSLVAPSRLAMLLLVSGRGWKVDDEPQHRLMGEHLEAFLEAAGVPWVALPTDEAHLASAVAAAADQARRTSGPVALVVAKGTFDKATVPPAQRGEGPTRREAIAAIAPLLGDAVLVTTTGFTSRDAYAVADRPRNFYMQGSMGHASSIGLGLALAGHRVVVLDGDGAALMHLSALAEVGQWPRAPLCHVIFDNGVHESTGSQRISESPVDFAGLARAAGYRHVHRVERLEDLAPAFQAAGAFGGPSCLVVSVRVDTTGPSPRVTEGLKPDELATRLRASLRRS